MANLHLGTIGWSYNFWKGLFYPAKTPSKDLLSCYSTHFPTVEVDSTFYRVPTEQAVLNWKKQTPEDFLFALKFPQLITHVKQLKDTQTITETFIARAKILGQKLGPLLLQFPPNFSAEHFQDLENYLKGLPKDSRYVVEVRNGSWLTRDFYALLKSQNVAVAWSDGPRTPAVNEVTSDFLYIRWEGNRKTVNGTLGKIEADRREDLTVWAKKINPYLEMDMEVFGYFGKYYSGYPPSDVEFLQSNLS